MGSLPQPFPTPYGRYRWVLGAGHGVAGWELPRLCASGGCLLEETSPPVSSAIPIQVHACGTEEGSRTTRKPPQGACHPGCPLLGLSPEAANINQCKHVKLNGLFILPTAAILMRHCLHNYNIAGQLAAQVCSDCSEQLVRKTQSTVLWNKPGERQTWTPESAALAMICYEGLFYCTSVSPIRKRSLIRATRLSEER